MESRGVAGSIFSVVLCLFLASLETRDIKRVNFINRFVCILKNLIAAIRSVFSERLAKLNRLGRGSGKGAVEHDMLAHAHIGECGDMDMDNLPPIRFRLDIDRCIQGVQYLAAHRPGITQFYVGVAFFFADKNHLLDWGRPISGDQYIATEHGPVPFEIYELLKSDSGAPDEIASALNARIRTVTSENRIQIFSLQETPSCPALSRTDREYLFDSLQAYGKMGYNDLKRICDQDPAYASALSHEGVNNELDLRLWFKNDPDLLEEIYETAPVRRRA